MPYQVLGDRSGAAAVTVTWTRSATTRSSGVIFSMLSRSACRPSAFLAPLLPSARSSAAGAFMAARSSALKPPDSVSLVSVDIGSSSRSRWPRLDGAFDDDARTGRTPELLDSRPIARVPGQQTAPASPVRRGGGRLAGSLSRAEHPRGGADPERCHDQRG